VSVQIAKQEGLGNTREFHKKREIASQRRALCCRWACTHAALLAATVFAGAIAVVPRVEIAELSVNKRDAAATGVFVSNGAAAVTTAALLNPPAKGVALRGCDGASLAAE
jgi:hypothetical protein